MNWNRHNLVGATRWNSSDGRWTIVERSGKGNVDLFDYGCWVAKYVDKLAAELDATRIHLELPTMANAAEPEQDEAHEAADLSMDAGWRLERYVESGLPYEQAERLALLSDDDGLPLDWHRVVDLLAAGCTPQLAEAIAA